MPDFDGYRLAIAPDFFVGLVEAVHAQYRCLEKRHRESTLCGVTVALADALANRQGAGSIVITERMCAPKLRVGHTAILGQVEFAVRARVDINVKRECELGLSPTNVLTGAGGSSGSTLTRLGRHANREANSSPSKLLTR
ncbi:hypothetical protein F2P45_33600 [Massilia sp. CCM 8733]|uniref:Uncharacterized protein n=1 Tax=Massilia mucilaginosa TaxID=2609282 RepID=A0ABX0P5A6_9BURK|nr:hypothetical protein [Massilia mucilaginosa]NHZ93896.1 hypothetical protein [Massilia mucilaginosa]